MSLVLLNTQLTVQKLMSFRYLTYRPQPIDLPNLRQTCKLRLFHPLANRSKIRCTKTWALYQWPKSKGNRIGWNLLEHLDPPRTGWRVQIGLLGGRWNFEWLKKNLEQNHLKWSLLKESSQTGLGLIFQKVVYRWINDRLQLFIMSTLKTQFLNYHKEHAVS